MGGLLDRTDWRLRDVGLWQLWRGSRAASRWRWPESGQLCGSQSASTYIGLASASHPVYERDRLTLLAVEQWLFAGRWAGGHENALRQVVTPSDGELLVVVECQCGSTVPLARQSGPGALPAGTAVPATSARKSHRCPRRGACGPTRGSRKTTRCARSRSLYTARKLAGHRRRPTSMPIGERLWTGLQVSHVRGAEKRCQTIASDPVARGWLSLGALANSTGQQGIGWGNGHGVRWQHSVPVDHPAFSVILSDLSLPEDNTTQLPTPALHLLLPLSGNNAAGGQCHQKRNSGRHIFAAIWRRRRAMQRSPHLRRQC